jgi:ABC-2 type transport system ATP-binding protein
VIILDEPTVGLDPNQIREIRALIIELGRSHSVILSSHILPEIQAVCGRVMIINRGRAVYNEPVASAHGAGVTVELRRPPRADALRAVAGVQQVNELGGGRFRLHCADGADPREALAGRAARNDWGLVELRSEGKTLEEIFVELTSGDEPREATTVAEAA